MSDSIPQITLDTNVIKDLTRDFNPAIEKRLNASKKLLEFHNSGRIKLWYLPNEEKKHNADVSDDLIENPGVIILGRWRAGKHILGSERDSHANDEIKRILKIDALIPDSKRGTDGYLLLIHYHYQRDYFVTSDAQILNQKDELKRSLQIEVLDPVAMIQHLETILGTNS